MSLQQTFDLVFFIAFLLVLRDDLTVQILDNAEMTARNISERVMKLMYG